MKNWKTSVTGIATALFAALTALAVAPYSIGPVAEFIPPDLKAEIFKWCGLAAFVSYILKSFMQADAKPSAPAPPDVGGRPSVLDPKKIVLLIAGLGFIGLDGFVLTGCANDGSAGVSMGIPIGQDARYGTVVLHIGYTPPPSLYALVDAPAGLSLNDFKSVLKPRR